jgi:hypothetical protein
VGIHFFEAGSKNASSHALDLAAVVDPLIEGIRMCGRFDMKGLNEPLLDRLSLLYFATQGRL